jgi:hypothetical protein
MTDFKGGNHPRDKEGKFTDKDDDLIIVSGNELGSYSNIEELRRNTENYYRKNLQGLTAKRSDIGEIRFSRKGISETIHNSNEIKLKIVPYIKKIIENGELGD